MSVHRSSIVVIAGVVSLTTLVVAVIVAAIFTQKETDPTPWIVAVITFVAPTITSLLALVQADGAKTNTDQLKNGLLRRNVKEGYREAIDEMAEDTFDVPRGHGKRRKENPQ